MKKTIFSFLLALMSVAGINAQSQIFDVNGIYFRLMQDTISDTGGLMAVVTTKGNTNYYNGDVSIPSTVSYKGVQYPVKAISDVAFRGCKQITSINIPASVVKVPAGAFYGCSSLTTVTVSSDNTVYDSRENCNAVIETATNTLIAGCKNFVLPSSVSVIGDCALWGSNIASLVIPPDVTIGNWAFMDCTGLLSLTISEGVTSIGDGAFLGCTNIKTLDVPYGNYMAGNNIFGGCYNIETLNWNSPTVPSNIISASKSTIRSVVLGDSVRKIMDMAFDGCSQLKSIVIKSKNINYIGYSSFYGCDSLEYVYWNSRDTLYLLSQITRNVFASLKKLELGSSATVTSASSLRSCSNLVSIIVDPENPLYDSRNNCNAIIETEANRLLLGCSTTVIPDGVTEIGKIAFMDCNNLKTIQIPSSVEKIQASAFENTGLTSINIPQNVSYISGNIFEWCTELTSITVDPNNRVYDSRNNCNAIIESKTNTLIAGCQGTTIPDGITAIGDYAFSGSNLTSISIPSSVTTIGSYAFQGCYNLTSLFLPSTVESIGNYAFIYCESLSSLNIPASVNYIGAGAFEFCTSLQSISIPEGVTAINDYTFCYCNRLANLSIPSTVDSIGQYVFYNCNELQSAGPVGGGYNYEFNWDTIPSNAFRNLSSLRSVYIPKSVKAVYVCPVNNGSYNSVFYGCDSLESVAVSFQDTKLFLTNPQHIAYFMECPMDYRLYYLNPVRSLTILDDTVYTTSSWLMESIREIVISEYVKQIYPGALSFGPYSIGIPVEDFYELPFYMEFNAQDINVDEGNTNYSSVNGVLFNKQGDELLLYPAGRYGGYRIPSGTTSVAAESFKGCRGLRSITVPSSVKTIGEKAFEGCVALIDVVFDGSPEIGHYAFWGCSGINSVSSRDMVPGIMDLYDTPPSITHDFSEFDIARDNYNIIRRIYNTNLKKDVTEITSKSTTWSCDFVVNDVPAGRYRVGVGVVPNTEELPNKISLKVVAYTYDGSVVTLYSGRKGPRTINFDAGLSDYDSIIIPDTLDIPECYTVKLTITTVKGSNLTNRVALDQLFFEPAGEFPVESYAGPFTESVFANATLYVPQGAIDTYKAAEGWKLFKNIAIDTHVYPAEEIEVNISDAGYATFYYSDASYVLPEGLKAVVVSDIIGDRLIYEQIASGSESGVIPFGVPVILVSDGQKAGSYKLELADNDKPYYGNNFLIGSDNDTITFAYGNSLFYKLSYGPSNTDLSGVPGWYWGARNGGEFPIEGHKAWLAIPVSLTKGSNGYSMTGTPTYANEIPADIFDEEAVIYDLNGIRQLTPIGNGMSIINGKVVIIIE